jgi:hypothetical protein
MADGNPAEQNRDERGQAKQVAKKAYTKPAFRFERVFETQALSCGKISHSTICSLHRKSS